MRRGSSRAGIADAPLPPAPAGRVCGHPDCTTVLSQYNRNEYCGLHHRYEHDAGRLRQSANN